MNRPLSVYLASLTGAFAATVGMLAVRGDAHAAVTDWRTWLPLWAVAMLVEAFEVTVGDRDDGAALSFSGAAHVAAVILFGPLVAAAIAAGAVLLVDGIRSWSPRVVLANAALFGWSTLLAGGAYRLAGGTTGQLTTSSAVAVVVLVVVRGLVNVTLFSVGDALAAGASVRSAIRTTLAEGAVTYLGEGSIGVLVAAGWNAREWLILPFLLPLFAALYGARANLERLRRETASALNAFAQVIDERDPHTARHTERVAGYVQSFTEEIGLPAREARRLAEAARYHDLGKIAVDEATLSKATRLSDEEVRAIRRHPRLSAALLSPFGFARDIARIVELHHERYDGRGYYEVNGSEVPLEAHVLIVADSFDAMTSKRAYRPALTPGEAARELLDKAGTQFHPQVARTFAAMVQREAAEPLAAGELAELRAGFERVRAVPGIPWRSWGDLPTATIGAVAAAMLAVSIAPTTMDRTVALAALLAICLPALVASGVRRRRSSRALGLAAQGAPTAKALRAARVAGEPAWLRWDAERDRYEEPAGDVDAADACRRARLTMAGTVLALHSGAFAVLSSPTPDRSRLAVIFDHRPRRRDVRLVEAIAHATPGRSASETAHRPTGEAAGRPSTALVVGLDVFERVRVGAGQLAAAQAVRAAADAVRATLRDGDTVEPLGEDELAVWLDAAGGDELTAFCDRLARTLAAVPLPARQAPIAARIAIASSPDLPVDLAAHARIARAGSASDTRAAK